MSWTVLQCYVRSSTALSLPLCKTSSFCLCLCFTWSPYIHQRCKRILSGLLWACAFYSLLPGGFWALIFSRDFHLYFLLSLLCLSVTFLVCCPYPRWAQTVYISEPFNRCGSLECCSSPTKVGKGAKQRPIYVLVPEGTTNIKMQNHSILRKRSILAFWNQQSVPGTLANILCSPCTC